MKTEKHPSHKDLKKDPKKETYCIYRSDDPQKTSQCNKKNQKTME